MIDKTKIIRNPANTIGIVELDEAKKEFGDEWNKFIEVKNWIPIHDDFDWGDSLENLINPLNDEEVYVSPVIDGKIPAQYCYDLGLINKAIKIFDELDCDYIFRVHPDNPMPLIIQSPYSSAPVILIAPRVQS